MTIQEQTPQVVAHVQEETSSSFIDKEAFLKAFRVTLPILFGYLPTGIAFGLLFQQKGFPWFLAPIMSLFVYAASSQFFATALLVAGASLFEITLLTLIINSRHIFYGISLMDRFSVPPLKKIFLIWSLTDETYSLLTSTPPVKGHDEQYCLYVSFLNQFYMVLATFTGAFLGTFIKSPMPGIEFAIVALFVVLSIEQAFIIKKKLPFVIALLCTLAAYILVPQKIVLFTSIALCTAALMTVKFKEEKAKCQ
jgi:4-azaleucine resistance transporter AzlC